MKVLHIITGLGDGGAEMILYQICKFDDLDRHVVISLSGPGKYTQLLQEIGVKVFTCNLHSNKLLGLYLLIKYIRQIRPDVIQTWMYHGNLIGGIGARISGYRKIFWSIRNSGHNLSLFNFKTRVIVKLGGFFSSFIPVKIISCSSAALAPHIRLGYKCNQFVVIPNGYDVDRFSVCHQDAGKVRKQYLPSFDIPLLGMVARFDPSKDHENLFAALHHLATKGCVFKCLLIGSGLSVDNKSITDLLAMYGIEDHVLLLGPQANIPLWMNVIDIHVLSSAAEAFPNVLAEAMLSGTPCVSTDVGDASLIIGDTGWLVPPRDPVALSQALLEAIEEFKNPHKWFRRKELARKRIIDNFTIQKMINAYRELWSSA